jgi:hypothetical protein
MVVRGIDAGAIAPAPHPEATGTSGAVLLGSDGSSVERTAKPIRFGKGAGLDQHNAGAGKICRAAWSPGPALDDSGESELRAVLGATAAVPGGPVRWRPAVCLRSGCRFGAASALQ